MGYLHIENLYRPEAQDILQFRSLFALEKIHGTSAHIEYRPSDSSIRYFSGGESHSKFVSLFNETELLEKFKNLGIPADKTIAVFGEAYGGSQQGMSHTYGKQLKFVAFDVQIGDCWLNVPKAEALVKSLGLEFVYYTLCSLVKQPTDSTIWNNTVSLAEVDADRDRPSMQAVRNGVSTMEQYNAGLGPKREGIVLRPLFEVTKNNGSRVIAKHKGEAFKETATARPVVDPSKLQVLQDAEAVANEWVTQMRLDHVLQKIPDYGMDKVPVIINNMTEDVLREGSGEIVDSPAVRKDIGRKAAAMFIAFMKSKLPV